MEQSGNQGCDLSGYNGYSQRAGIFHEGLIEREITNTVCFYWK